MFNTFWNNLKRDVIHDKEFQTLRQRKGFSARFSEGTIKIFPESTMHQRNISQEEFIRVWNHAKNMRQGQQFVRANYNDMTRNGSYILAIMKNYLGDAQIE